MNVNRARRVIVAGSGSHLPGDPVPYGEIDRVLGTLDRVPEQVKKWMRRMAPLMREMVDIEFMHYAIDPATREFTEDNVTMSVRAARSALEAAGMAPCDVDFIAYGSAHQDQMPTASVRIQEALGIERCAELSVHANCTSAYKALLAAFEFIGSGRYDTALVISSSMSSSELRAEYYNQPLVTKEDVFLRWFLCDGAGALLLRASDGPGLALESVYMESAGGNKPSAMGNRRPAYWMNPAREFEGGYHHLSQMFQDGLRAHFHDPDGTVFYKGLRRMLSSQAIDLSGLKYFQVNLPSKHIQELVMEECAPLGIPAESLYTRMSQMGYCGPPMAFIALDRMIREGTLADGDLVLSFVTEVSKFMQAGYSMRYSA